MSGVKGKSGRPKGQKKTSRIQIMIEPEIKEEFRRITESNGSNPSVKICELIIEYIKENNKKRGV